MYMQHINNMNKAICDLVDKYPASPLDQCVHNALIGYWKNRIAFVWHVDDVLQVAKDNDLAISQKDAGKILRKIRDQHDAEQGVHWLTIECAIRAYTNA